MENIRTQMQVCMFGHCFCHSISWFYKRKVSCKFKLFSQVAQVQTLEAGNMRKRLDDENYVEDGSKKSSSNKAAEVADRLAASTSSQYIMSSVLSTFAAEEGLSKTTPVSNSISVSKPEFMPSQAPLATNGSYQPVLLAHQPTLVPDSQPQYHTIPNPHSQPYLQPAYPYGNVNVSIPPLAQPPSYMMSAMVPLTHQRPPMVPPPPNFSTIPTTPLQPPGMVFYGHPHHSQ